MRPATPRAVAALLTLALVGCDGEPMPSGASEPIIVHGADFHEGELPFDDEAETPYVANAGGVSAVVTQGQAGQAYGGVASTDAYAVAVAMPGIGTGYWVAPLGSPDVTQNDLLLFDVRVDFGRDVPFGLQTLSFVAIDGEGRPGRRYDVPVCVLPDYANGNLSACDPATTPQEVVISLTWDTQVDLDLVVVAPNGKIVSPKAPTTVLPGEDGRIQMSDLNDPSVGTLTRDSNSNCVIDGIRRESLIFVGEPPAGDYRVYARLHSPCGRRHVNWQATLYRRVETDDGTFAVEETPLASGLLLADQVSRGEALGTFVTTLTF